MTPHEASACEVPRSCAALLRAAAAPLLGLLATIGVATPYVPVSDDTILEQVPARAELERLAPLRSTLASDPGDLPAALALGTAYIEIGRRESDPRFIAYAQAALHPWMSTPQPPERVLVLQAITLQYLHQFDAALALLRRAVALEPLDPQAWLTQASLLELRGEYRAAHLACARLVRAAEEFSALTCLGSVASRNGELASSHAALAAPIALDARIPAPLRAWRLAVLADMEERLGDDRAAEASLQAALRAAPNDAYLESTYADLLLRTGRPREVLCLLAGRQAQDALLLRLTIAAHRTGSPQAGPWMQTYEARWRAAERDGDRTHQREQALYLLEVRRDSAAALALARSNWANQREPADLRLYERSAAAAHSAVDCEVITRWLGQTHYEDRALAALPACAAPGGGRS